jgi:deazaflavin-dependent oxidoreductase (nitroreductase family)
MREYEVKPSVKRVNGVMMWMAKRGMGPTSVLTTTGRKSGEARSVPVSPIAFGDQEYLVSPYGTVGWVRNARADDLATLGRKGDDRPVRLVEVTGSASDVVHAYWQREKYSRRFMDVPDDPSPGDFQERSAAFPVFIVQPR